MLTLAAILFAQAAAAQSSGQRAPSPLAPSEIVAKAPAADWVTIAPADLLVMDLAPKRGGASTGSARRVVIQLIPAPFSQGWVGNIRKLVVARFWDGTSVNRVQDNYVVQWGDASEKKPLPPGLAKVPESEYTQPAEFISVSWNQNGSIFWQDRLRNRNDAYTGSDGVGFIDGWPMAAKITKRSERRQDWPEGRRWPVHCYGMVGVGRNLSPDTGTGAELYTVIGHAPRHLDRNIALVGRVIEGMEHLSSLPRGTEALGFYKTAEERVPIVAVRMGNEVPGLPAYQYLSTESKSFAAYANARANRRDEFFIVPAGGADICNIPVPVRRQP